MNRNTFYFFILPCVPIFLFFLEPIGIGDLSVWIALGLDSVKQFKIITIDTYAVSETIPMVYPVLITWLYAGLYKINGLELVTFIHGLIPIVWIYIWYDYLKTSDRYKNCAHYWDRYSLFIFSAAFIGSKLMFVPRPALVASIPLLFSYYLIAKNQHILFNKKTIFVLAITEIVWTNIHGSFLLLPIILCWQIFFLLLEKNYTFAINRIKTVFIVSCCILINPFTWKVIPYTWETAQISKARGLDEWFPTHNFDYPFSSWYFYFVSFVLLIFLILNKNKIYSFIRNPLFIIWVSGFLVIRNTYLFFLIMPIFLFDAFLKKQKNNVVFFESKNASKINLLIISVFALIILIISPFNKKNIESFLNSKNKSIYSDKYKLTEINLYLQKHNGSVFNAWQYGSDLILSQSNKIFIDTRNIIYTDLINSEYESFIRYPENNKHLIDKYHFKYFVINKDQKYLLIWLKSNPKISFVLAEGPAFLFEKIN